MKCSEVKSHLPLYSDDSLSSAERAELDSHLDACPLCYLLGGVVGELTMGFATKFAMRRSLNLANREPMPDEFVDAVWEHFDHGTQRAILKLYRSAPPEALAAAGTRLGSLEAPALIVWGDRDPYITTDFAHAYAEALGGPATVRIAEDAGHWPWLDEPALVDEIAGFLTA